jgi:hypothetical protein
MADHFSLVNRELREGPSSKDEQFGLSCAALRPADRRENSAGNLPHECSTCCPGILHLYQEGYVEKRSGLRKGIFISPGL